MLKAIAHSATAMHGTVKSSNLPNVPNVRAGRQPVCIEQRTIQSENTFRIPLYQLLQLIVGEGQHTEHSPRVRVYSRSIRSLSSGKLMDGVAMRLKINVVCCLLRDQPPINCIAQRFQESFVFFHLSFHFFFSLFFFFIHIRSRVRLPAVHCRVSTWMGDCLGASKPPQYVTMQSLRSTHPSGFHPSGVGKLSSSLSGRG